MGITWDSTHLYPDYSKASFMIDLPYPDILALGKFKLYWKA